MKCLFLAASLLLPATALRADAPYQLETKLYVYKNADFHEAIVGDAPAKEGASQVFRAPLTARFDGTVLSFTGGEAQWNGGDSSPRAIDLIATPVIPLTPDHAVSILSSAPAQFQEQQPDGSLKQVEVPADSPLAPHCRFTFVLPEGADPDGTFPLSCEADLLTIRMPHAVPSASQTNLPALRASYRDTLRLPVRPGEWTAVSLRSPSASDYSLLLLVRVTAADERFVLKRVGDYKLKFGRFGGSAVTDGRYIYSVGGVGWEGKRGDIERFDPLTHQSEVIAKALTPRDHGGAALLDGKIYVFGGIAFDAAVFQDYDNTLEIYDLATGKLSRGANLPSHRGYFATAVVRGKIYAMGGTIMRLGHPVETPETSVYDPVTDAWQILAPMRWPRENRAAVVIDDAIVVAGGYRRPKVGVGLKTVEAYFPGKNSWVELPDLSLPVAAHSGAVLGGHLFLFGNFDPANQILDYNFRAYTTAEVKHQMISSGQTTAVTLGGSIFVLGGIGGGGREWHGRSDAHDYIQEFRLVPVKN